MRRCSPDFVTPMMSELEMIALPRLPQHHAVESVMVFKGTEHRKAEPLSVHRHHGSEMIRWSGDAHVRLHITLILIHFHRTE